MQSYPTPFTFSATKTSSNQQKPTQSGELTISRAPVVHCFVCDHANAKVKILTDEFIDLLTKSGIKVYAERYLTHQPGFQVRAASLNTQADFFFQIHSKTAGVGHVRLYINGQPKRMTKEEAVSAVWSLWRLRCGALNKDEADLLSGEKIYSLLKEFVNIDENMNLNLLQQQARNSLENGTDIHPIISHIIDYQNLLNEAKTKISSTPTMSSEWVFEQGSVLQNCTRQPFQIGLSFPLKTLLLSIIEQTLKKCVSIEKVIRENYEKNIHKNNLNHNSNIVDDDDNLNEIPIDINNDQPEGDGSSWKMMIESVGEDRIGSIKIASYGESPTVRSCDRISTPIFKFDDDF